MRKLLIHLISFFVLAPVWAAQSVDLCFESWPPYAYIENGRATGLSIELYRQAFTELGITPHFVERPWARCQLDTQQNRAAGILFDVADTGKTPGLEVGHVSIESWAIGVFVGKESPFLTFEGIEQFKNQRFGKLIGYTYTPEVDVYKGWKIVEVSRPESAIRMLSLGRVDVLLGDIIYGLDLIKQENLQVRLLQPLLTINPTYIAFNKNYKDLIPKLDAKLQALIDSGVVDKTYQERLGISWQTIKSWKVYQPKIENHK